jgi:hypothetical protein
MGYGLDIGFHTELHFIQITGTQTSVLSLLQSPLAVFWRQI